MERRRTIGRLLLVAIVSSLLGVLIGQAGLVPKPGPDTALGRVQRLISRGDQPPAWGNVRDLHRLILQRYVEDVDEEVLVKGALEGMVRALDDPYSTYMTPDRYQQMVERYQADFTGIGIRVQQDEDGYLRVVRPVRDTPGERAGLRTNDRIVKVDGEDIGSLTLEEQVSMIRGPAGTAVTLTVERRGRPQPMELRIERAVITLAAIEYRMLEDDIGYVQVIEFTMKLGERVQKAVDELRALGMRGLILDLRQNPGGLLSEAVSLSAVFVPEGPVVHIVQRDGRQQTEYSGNKGFDLPLVVLVDEHSASASEIVAGAIRDRMPEAKLVGTTTFGKGLVQNFFELEGGAGLRLTTARYLTAGGHSIHGTGVEPHIRVELPPVADGEPQPGLDDPANPQLLKALEVLRQLMQ